MKKIVLMIVTAAVMAMTLTISASATKWERYDESGTQLGSMPEGFPTPCFELYIRPYNAWAGMGSEQNVKLIVNNYISCDVKGTMTLTSDIIKDGKADIPFELAKIGGGDKSTLVSEVTLKPNVTAGEHNVSAEVTFDIDPGCTYKTELQIKAEEPETRYFTENETTEYFYGDKYTMYSENEDIVEVSGGLVRCLKAGSCYVIAKSNDTDPMKYNEYCTRIVVTRDTRFDDSDGDAPVYNDPQVTNDGAVTILPIGYGVLDDNSGSCYTFDVQNTTGKPIDITVTGTSPLFTGGTFSENYTLGKSGESSALVNVKAKLAPGFLDLCYDLEGALTEFKVVYNDGTDNRVSKLSVTLYPEEHISANFEPDQTYPIETNYTWLSSDPSIVSVEKDEATAHAEGDVTLIGTTSDGKLLVYDVTVHKDTSEDSGNEDGDGRKTLRITPYSIVAALFVFALLYGIMRKIILRRE